MPKVTKKTEGKGDAMVNTETGEETEMADDPLRPVFAPLGVQEMSGKKCEYRKVNVPQHRFTPLKEHWLALYEPVTKQMKIDMRMNLKTKKVELKTTQATEDEGALQKSADFIQAFLLGFEVQDAVALLRQLARLGFIRIAEGLVDLRNVLLGLLDFRLVGNEPRYHR